MGKNLRVLGILLALMFGLVASMGATGTVSAQSTGCDTTGTHDGTATPAYGTAGTTITFRGTGFTPGEAVSFWFTLPDGRVAGTPSPIPNGVNADGTIGPLPFPIDQSFVDLGAGRWAITFQGATSSHTAVIYFCVLTAAQATAIAQPTNTAVAPTATSVPATATTAATAVATEVATAAATNTAAPVATTAATEVPTIAIAPTLAPTIAVEATSTPEVVTGGTTGGIPGMPTTGQSDNSMSIAGLLALLSVSLLSLGVVARRRAAAKR